MSVVMLGYKKYRSWWRDYEEKNPIKSQKVKSHTIGLTQYFSLGLVAIPSIHYADKEVLNFVGAITPITVLIVLTRFRAKSEASRQDIRFGLINSQIKRKHEIDEVLQDSLHRTFLFHAIQIQKLSDKAEIPTPLRVVRTDGTDGDVDSIIDDEMKLAEDHDGKQNKQYEKFKSDWDDAVELSDQHDAHSKITERYEVSLLIIAFVFSAFTDQVIEYYAKLLSLLGLGGDTLPAVIFPLTT